MTKKVFKDPRAIKLCEDIRWVYNINHRDKWVCRVDHKDKKIVVGHPDYCNDLDISCQVNALISALEQLGLAEALGYTIKNFASLDDPA